MATVLDAEARRQARRIQADMAELRGMLDAHLGRVAAGNPYETPLLADRWIRGHLHTCVSEFAQKGGLLGLFPVKQSARDRARWSHAEQRWLTAAWRHRSKDLPGEAIGQALGRSHVAVRVEAARLDLSVRPR